MTDAPQPESGDQIPVELEDLSPLRELVAEMHEIHDELLYAGFEEPKAERIVAHMLLSAIAYRDTYDGSSDEDEDADEDNSDDSSGQWTGES